MSDGSRPLPSFPGAPEPGAPVPRTPVEGFDLQAYARVAVELAERPGDRASVLSGHGLDEPRWIAVEKAWLLRVALAALQDDLSLAEELERASSAAREALAPNSPTRSLEEYATLTARIEAGGEPALVLAEAGVGLPEWSRLCRAWAVRMAVDPELSRTFRALVRERR